MKGPLSIATNTTTKIPNLAAEIRKPKNIEKKRRSMSRAGTDLQIEHDLFESELEDGAQMQISELSLLPSKINRQGKPVPEPQNQKRFGGAEADQEDRHTITHLIDTRTTRGDMKHHLKRIGTEMEVEDDTCNDSKSSVAATSPSAHNRLNKQNGKKRKNFGRRQRSRTRKNESTGINLSAYAISTRREPLKRSVFSRSKHRREKQSDDSQLSKVPSIQVGPKAKHKHITLREKRRNRRRRKHTKSRNAKRKIWQDKFAVVEVEESGCPERPKANNTSEAQEKSNIEVVSSVEENSDSTTTRSWLVTTVQISLEEANKLFIKDIDARTLFKMTGVDICKAGLSQKSAVKIKNAVSAIKLARAEKQAEENYHFAAKVKGEEEKVSSDESDKQAGSNEHPNATVLNLPSKGPPIKAFTRSYTTKEQNLAQTRIASAYRGLLTRTRYLREYEWRFFHENQNGRSYQRLLQVNAYSTWFLFAAASMYFNIIWGVKFNNQKVWVWLRTGTGIIAVDLLVVQPAKITLLWLIRKRILLVFLLLMYVLLVGIVVLCEEVTSKSSLEQGTGNLICDLIPA